MQNDGFFQQLRLFHYATRLPVHCIQDGIIVSSLPSELVCGEFILGGNMDLPSLLNAQETTSSLCHVDTRLKESFFALRFQDDTWAICGPYCQATFDDAAVLRMIRTLRLPLVKQDQLTSYFAGLPHLSTMNIYYASMLFERLLRSECGIVPMVAVRNKTDDLARRFYQNAYENRMNLFRHPPYFFEQEISKQIAAGNRDHALQLLNELNTLERAHLADTPLRSLKNSLIASVTLFTRAAISGGVPSDEAFTLSDSFIQLIEFQQDMQLLATMEEMIILRFVDSVIRYRDRQYSLLIRKTIDLIDGYLTEELSAAWLAERVYVHPDYLSARFHREVNETLHRFILRRRIEEAAHYICYGTDSVSSIAAFYRFSSQSHFITTFKKVMGTTPAKYAASQASLSTAGVEKRSDRRS